MQTNNNDFSNVFNSAISQLGNVIDVDTVIGKPIVLEDGECIIPFSKVTFGILSGGGEYGKVNIFSKNDKLPKSVGNGSVVSVNPCGFLVRSSKDGTFKILSSNQTDYEKIFNKVIEFFENCRDNIWKN